jgi:hypothetical protein
LNYKVLYEQTSDMKVQIRRLAGIGLTVALILLIPLIAMQFTDEVNWKLSDFVLMGTILFGLGLTYELIARRSEKMMYRVALGVGLAGAFLLFWVNAAVGIIGNEGQTVNFLYGLVFLVGIIGAFSARFQASGMARTLLAMAATQMLVPVVALLIWPPPAISWSPGIMGVFVLSAFFAMLFLVSGLLFRMASREGNLQG